MSSITTTHALPEEVLRYCESHDLLSHLETLLRLADECFSPIDRLAVSLEADPEVEDDEVLVIDVWIKSTVEDALARRAAYTRRSIDLVPSSALDRIVLLYYLS